MGMTDRLSGAWKALTAERSSSSWDPYSLMTFNGIAYPLGLNQTQPGAKTEEIDQSYAGLAAGAYKGNAIVFACMMTRLAIFTEARFQFRRMRNGKPGDLFGNASLDILEHPWGPGSTTGDLLSRMLIDADLGGNAFVTRRGGKLRRLRPDWVSIILGSEDDPDVDNRDFDADVLGYVYYPGGKHSGKDPNFLLREEVAHFAPLPDPEASYRGMSWLTPIIREIMSDSAATDHKLRFFENGATPNMVVSLDKDIALNAFNDWVAKFKEREPSGFDAYKTLYLGAGAQATVVGKDLKQLDFKATQGAGESRIAADAGVHPTIVGLSEGLQGSSLNSGNFGAARRLVADKTMSWLWRNVSGSLEVLVPPPPSSDLWYDASGIPFLREDRKDAAEIQQIKAATIRQLVDAGYEPESVVKAVESEDMGLLKHSGLYSVQLQPPGTTTPTPDPAAPVIPPKKPVPARSLDKTLAPFLNQES
jgi:hypothetical protein